MSYRKYLEPGWETARCYLAIAAHIRAGLLRYVRDGIPPGGFLRAVFENDLFQAVGRADGAALDSLPYICQFVWNYCPSDCHGSKGVVERWCAEQGPLAAEENLKVVAEAGQ